MELDDGLFGVQPNIPLMHQVVTAQLAARRAGTQSTKTRAERKADPGDIVSDCCARRPRISTKTAGTT